MKDKLISIAGNGLPWGLAAFTLAFLMGYYEFNMPAGRIAWMAATISLVVLTINGFFYSRFTRPLKDLKPITIEISATETLLLEAIANHLTEDSLVAGKLYLTNQRLVFKPHSGYKLTQPSFSWEQPIFSWDLADIEPHKFYGSIWNADGEFLLTTKEGTIMFEVDKLKQWKAALQKNKENV